MDCSPPGSSVHGILQARILEWVAIPFSRRSSRPRDRTRGLPHYGLYSLPSKPPGKPSLPPKGLPNPGKASWVHPMRIWAWGGNPLMGYALWSRQTPHTWVNCPSCKVVFILWGPLSSAKCTWDLPRSKNKLWAFSEAPQALRSGKEGKGEGIK